MQDRIFHQSVSGKDPGHGNGCIKVKDTGKYPPELLTHGEFSADESLQRRARGY